ncbi:MAG TPA: hypothetical protein VFS08_01160 [Gemmatimonadaceae bacterium]|nr:hypothetical protein [Gemmatimonadaceae bacterium]
MHTELVVLRLIHVLSGIFWVGSGLFTSLFLVPALAGSGGAMGQVMGGLQRRGLFIALPVAGLLTIASGLRLMWITSGGFDAAYFASPGGQAFALAGAAAVLGFLVGLLAARPAAARAGRLGSELGAASDEAARTRLAAELGRVRRRGALANGTAVALLVLAAAGMAVARYVG